MNAQEAMGTMTEHAKWSWRGAYATAHLDDVDGLILRWDATNEVVAFGKAYAEEWERVTAEPEIRKEKHE